MFVMFLIGVLTIISSCGVVFSKKPLHSALFLVLTLFLVAVHFALLDAQFIAALQIVVYAGAIMVLVVFVILLLGLDDQASPPNAKIFNYAAAAVTGSFVGVLAVAFKRGFIVETASSNLPTGGNLPTSGASLSDPSAFGSTETVGRLLFTEYLYPFEIASVLLLAAIVGAVVLSLDKKRALPPGRGLKAMREES